MSDLVAQIRMHFERDMKSDAMAVGPNDIPITYERITPEWLTHFMCKGVPGAKVTRSWLDEPDNGSANRRRVFMEYNAEGKAAGLPESVFCKASQDLANRINLGNAGATHAEVTFYKSVRPLVKADMPEAYFAAYDPQSFNSIIVLKDIGKDVEFCREWTENSRARAESQIDLLATYHGRFYDDHDLVSGKLGLISWPAFFDNCLRNELETYCNKGFLASEGNMPDRLFKRYKEVWPATLKAVEIHHGKPMTLLHGDCHWKQWYIRPVDKMGLTDWQNATYGNWGRDVAYAMSTSLAIEQRRAWEKDLLKLYLEKMAAKGAKMPSFDEAFRLYRQHMLTALAWWTVTLTPGPDYPDMQPQATSIAFINRMAQAIDDLESLDAF